MLISFLTSVTHLLATSLSVYSVSSKNASASLYTHLKLIWITRYASLQPSLLSTILFMPMTPKNWLIFKKWRICSWEWQESWQRERQEQWREHKQILGMTILQMQCGLSIKQRFSSTPQIYSFIIIYFTYALSYIYTCGLADNNMYLRYHMKSTVQSMEASQQIIQKIQYKMISTKHKA